MYYTVKVEKIIAYLLHNGLTSISKLKAKMFKLILLIYIKLNNSLISKVSVAKASCKKRYLMAKFKASLCYLDMTRNLVI